MLGRTRVGVLLGLSAMTYMGENGVPVTGAIKKVSWWHESIVDWELANPQLTLGDCAQYFGVTPSWLSTVRNSDAFKAYAMKRRAEYNEMVSLGLTGQLQQLATEAVGEMLDRVKNEKSKLEFGEVHQAGSLALKALGFGAGQMGNPNRIPDRGSVGITGNVTINNTIVATPDVLARAREKMRQLNAQQAQSAQPQMIDISPASERDAAE